MTPAPRAGRALAAGLAALALAALPAAASAAAAHPLSAPRHLAASPSPSGSLRPTASPSPSGSRRPTASPSPATPPVATTTPPGRLPYVAFILLDTHRALGLGGLRQEQAAAEAYARDLRPGVLESLITFSTQLVAVVPPSPDRARVISGIGTAPLIPGNSQGVVAALAAAGSAAKRLEGASAATHCRLVVFTDGAGLNQRLPVPPIPTEVVQRQYNSHDHIPVLRAMARASGGEVVGDSQVAALAAAFPGAVTPSPSPKPTPTPTPRPTPTRATAAPTFSPAPAGAGPAHPGSPWQKPLIAMLLAVFVCLLGFAYILLGGLTKLNPSVQLAERIQRYGPHHTDAADTGAVSQAALGWASRLLAGDREQRLAVHLDLAGVKVKPAEFVVLSGCGCAVLAAVAAVVTTSPVGAIGGLVFGGLGIRFGLSFKIGHRRSAFAKQLPDMLQLVAGSLASGFSLPQALGSLAKEDTQPCAGEFERALAQTRYGVDLEVALHQIADRMESADLRWAVMAIRIQRQVGGNLGEVLGTTVNTMRERAQLKGQVRALSAEGRLSGYVLIAMPIAIAGWLFMTNPAYLAPLFNTVPGLVMIIGASVMVVVGAFWMRKLVKIQV